MNDIKGRRLRDCTSAEFPIAYEHLRDGDFWKILDRETGLPEVSNIPGNLTHTVWMFMGPNGSGIGTLRAHTVREHENGNISVLPGDGSSNSILQDNGYPGDRRRVWHGYIYDGVWSEEVR